MSGHRIDPEDMPARHSLSDRFVSGDWNTAGRCICGAALPPWRRWHDAGAAWTHVRCPSCRTLFVDEEDFIAIYDDEDSRTEPCCAAEEAEHPRGRKTTSTARC